MHQPCRSQTEVALWEVSMAEWSQRSLPWEEGLPSHGHMGARLPLCTARQGWYWVRPALAPQWLAGPNRHRAWPRAWHPSGIAWALASCRRMQAVCPVLTGPPWG